MFSINNPELAVEDAPCQAAKVHLPHLNSFKKEEIRWKKTAATVLPKLKHTAVNVVIKHRGVTFKPFCFKIFKSVEFVLTLGTLVTTRTDTFLEGNSSSSLRMSLPCRGQTQHYRLFSQTQQVFHVCLCFSWQLTGMSEEELTLMSSPVKVQ